MKIYLVGGAVRDKLMGISIKDRDYVVVGSTPEEMIKLGYKPIGKDFPVFLHPKTNEEYALARTEKKVGKGYHGFEFFASPKVTLEEDLKRRDITINAIAEDEDGTIYDPYNGLEDIKNKVIRHVSDAFIEDPLRVLRVARFAALDDKFTVQKETLVLMKKIVTSGELKSLSVERIVGEITKGLEAKHPDKMLFFLCDCDALNEVVPGLNPIPDLSWQFIQLGEAIKSNPKLLTAEYKIILLLLVPFFGDYYGADIVEHQERLLKYLKMSSQSHKIVKSIRDEESNLNNFNSLSAEDKLDCLYRLDFFRRPNITFKILDMLSVVAKVFKKIVSADQKLLLEMFAKELNELKIEVSPSNSNEKNKEFIYQKRLSILKKLVSN